MTVTVLTVHYRTEQHGFTQQPSIDVFEDEHDAREWQDYLLGLDHIADVVLATRLVWARGIALPSKVAR